MKNHRPLFRWIAPGIVAGALLLWLLQSKRSDRPPSPATAPVTASASPPNSIPSLAPTGTAAPSLENRATAPTPGRSNADLLVTVRAKLRQWLATKTGDTETQERLTGELVTLLTNENTAEVIGTLSPQEFDTPFATKALERWLEIDPADAARWLAARPDAREEHAVLVARSLLQDPAELRDYCDRLSEGTWKENVLNYASLEAISKDPVGAIALAQRMTSGDARTNALETIAYDWFGRDLAGAVNWTKSVEDPLLRERLLAVGAKAIATADPDLAAGWLVSSVKTEGVLNETALSLVETWAGQHPAQAANWVARFSEAGPRKAAIDLLLNHWLKSDPASANAWIQNLPEREAILAQLKAEQAERERKPDLE